MIPPAAVSAVPGQAVELGVFFLAGLLGGAHCLGMCGPVVTLYGEKMSPRTRGIRWLDVLRHLWFNLGRTAGYAGVGLILGLAGEWVYGVSGLLVTADLVRGTVGVGVRLFILLTGAGYLFYGSARGLGTSLESLPLGGAYSFLHRWMDGWVKDARIFYLGSLHALLPCPILYPAYLYALGRGRPVAGALALGTLGLGTLPTLLVYAVAIDSVGVGKRRWMHRVLGAVFLVLGYLSLSMGARSIGFDVPVMMPPYVSPLR